jgi:hypothetical protein
LVSREKFMKQSCKECRFKGKSHNTQLPPYVTHVQRALPEGGLAHYLVTTRDLKRVDRIATTVWPFCWYVNSDDQAAFSVAFYERVAPQDEPLCATIKKHAAISRRLRDGKLPLRLILQDEAREQLDAYCAAALNGPSTELARRHHALLILGRAGHYAPPALPEIAFEALLARLEGLVHTGMNFEQAISQPVAVS